MRETPFDLNERQAIAVARGIKTELRIPLPEQPPERFNNGDVAVIQNLSRNRFAFSRIPHLGAPGEAWPADPLPGFECPIGNIGDRIWFRECYATHWGSKPFGDGAPVPDRSLVDGELVPQGDGSLSTTSPDHPLHVYYRKFPAEKAPLSHLHWYPAEQMPQWMSRYSGVIASVDVQRLKNITEAEAREEGAEPVDMYDPTENHCPPGSMSFREGFSNDWVERFGFEGWRKNLWVFAVTFQLEAR